VKHAQPCSNLRPSLRKHCIVSCPCAQCPMQSATGLERIVLQQLLNSVQLQHKAENRHAMVLCRTSHKLDTQCTVYCTRVSHVAHVRSTHVQCRVDMLRCRAATAAACAR
jgi:hypothetical protein